jgi:hypothetical protein
MGPKHPFIATHNSCGVTQRVRLPNPEGRLECVCCDDSASWKDIVDLESFDLWLEKFTFHELDPYEQKHNKRALKQAFERQWVPQFKVRCRTHKDQTFLRTPARLRLARDIRCCRKAAALAKRKYTARYLETELLPELVTVDLKKSGLGDLDELVIRDKKLHLVCGVHGPLDKQYTTYQLARLPELIKTSPCNRCEPLGTVPLTPQKIRAYIESEDRLRSHGAIFTLLTSDSQIKYAIACAEKSGANKHKSINLKIRCETDSHDVANKGDITFLTYAKFVKGSIGQSSALRRRCHLHQILEFLCHALSVPFETEVVFDGLTNRKSGRHLYIDLYFRGINLPVEVEGLQHVAEKYQLGAKTKEEKKKKFKSQQDRDEDRDKYFSSKAVGSLILLKAFKEKPDGTFRWLSYAESYDAAMEFLTTYIKPLYPDLGLDSLPRKEELMLIEMERVWHNQKERVAIIYKGFFELIGLGSPGSTYKRTRYVLKCVHGHYIEISEGTVASHKPFIATIKDARRFCKPCHSAKLISRIDRNCSQAWLEIVDRDVVIQKFLGTVERPANAKLRAYDVLKFRQRQDSGKRRGLSSIEIECTVSSALRLKSLRRRVKKTS